MCGIVGALDLKSRPLKKSVIEKMTRRIAHRGPNDEGIFMDSHVGLGNRRLSILDLTRAGHMPMSLGESQSANRKSPGEDIWITFNGEIYNYIELKQELGGDYKSSSDTEVILKAYEKWGDKCLEKLNGIFAFAIWDAQKQQLFSARDRLGVKPFYYAVYDGIFYFGSEIKALFEAGVPALPNNEIIYDYLVRGFYEHSEETFFRGIKQLMPGHLLKIQNSKIKIQKYWDLPSRIEDLSSLSEAEVTKRYSDLVTDSIRIQLRSDVPIGINVSGGLDSSILTETVNRICGGQRNFKLYSWVYGEEKYDETPYVKALANHFGWSVEFFRLTPELALEILPKVMEAEEQPFPGISILARHHLYREVDPKTIVFLEGHGGDEIGGGYEYYVSSSILDEFTAHGWQAAKQELNRWQAIKGFKTEPELLKFFRSGLEAHFAGGTSADATRFASSVWLSPDLLSGRGTLTKFQKPFASFLANMQYRDMHQTKLPRVLRSVDRNSMAYGKEVRVPFLDHRIVEFAFSLPVDKKIRQGEQRFFMRAAFRNKLTHHNVNVPKRAVPDPQRDWLKRELRPWVLEILNSASFRNRGYFDQKQVLEEYARYCKSPEALNSFHIWQWLNLELWFRMFIDK